jgi:hypothetical protein
MIFVRLLATVALFFVAARAAAVERDNDGQLVERMASIADKVHQYRNANVYANPCPRPARSERGA